MYVYVCVCIHTHTYTIKNSYISSLVLCLSQFELFCAGDKIEKNEMVGASSAVGGGERRV
jgi:hypothetical protein